MSSPDIIASMPPLRILAFEPFDAGSHRAVRESISRHSRHHWTWLTLPGRAWKWRMRLGAIELIEHARRGGHLDRAFDAIFLTSLMSAADLRALLPKHLRSTPLCLFMHENQAAYPQGHVVAGPAAHDVQFALTNLVSLLAADLVIWNSRWNQESFTRGMASILKHAPSTPMPDWKERIESRSRVIWPPVEEPPKSLSELAAARVLHNAKPAEAGGAASQWSGPPCLLPVAASVSSNAANEQARSRTPHDAASSHRPVRVVWPHRWEHDKGPDRLLAIARRWSEPLNLRWTLLGEQFRTTPPELTQFLAEFAARIDHAGHEPDRARYFQRLASCDWVLTTTRHEFFGIAMVEAMLCGCLPWVETDGTATNHEGRGSEQAGGMGILPMRLGDAAGDVIDGGTGVSPVSIRHAAESHVPFASTESAARAGHQSRQLPKARLGFSYGELLPREAKHLHPATFDAAETEAQSVRRMIRDHLGPAAAPVATGLIDDAMAAMIDAT